jgi:iron complex transport system substrate-binding protein
LKTRQIKIQINLGAAITIVAALLLSALPAQAVQVKDDRGVTVTLDKTPKRIVSLLPSLTESVCALGQCERLVGVDRYSNYPQSVLALPKLGGGLDPNIEAVVAQKPDLVLLASSSRGSERLEALGLKVLALEPKTHADVQRVLLTLAQVLDVPDGARVWQKIDLAVQAAAQSIPGHVKRAKVYFEVSTAPHGAGEASFIGETLTRLGVKNIVPASMGPFPKLNPEFIVHANPDVVMIGPAGALNLAQRPGWGNIRAIREQRVCVLNAEDVDVLERAGPRMAQGARLMAQCLTGKAP